MKKIKKKPAKKIIGARESAVGNRQAENLDRAEHLCKKILNEQPDNAQALFRLGSIYRAKGLLDEATRHFRRTIEINPSHADAYTDLGSALQAKGHVDEAILHYQKAIEIRPDHAIALYNLGSAFHEKGQLPSAISYYEKCLQLNPNAMAYNNIGSAFMQKGDVDEAVSYYQKAVKFNPNYAYAYYNLGTSLREQNRHDEAIAAYDRVIGIHPDNMAAHLARCVSQLPIMYPTEPDIRVHRDRYSTELMNLATLIDIRNPRHLEAAAAAVGSHQPFYLAYQGLNDRDLQRFYGNLVYRIMSARYPQFSGRPSTPTAPHGERLRVGIVSGFFCYHSNWKIPIKGWGENLDRDRFALYGYYTGKIKDQETATARQFFSKFVEDVFSFENLCGVIKEDDLHVLLYPEIGMDPLTVQLASVWLAPVQCASWGHPDTSGLPTIDYYLSSDLMEPPDAENHYTERLVRLPNLSVFYTPPDVRPAEITRETFGLRATAILYLCCQSLFKYLPRYDEVYPRIAEQVKDCQFLFIAHKSSAVTEQFRSRLYESFKRFHMDAERHVVILPRLDPAQFHGTNLLADIYLDSIGWSGCNSTLEAAACDLPVVTLPGEFMRGRHSFAILTMMGMTETIAETIDDYVMLAVRLARDPEWRRSIANRVAGKKHLLYRDKTCITALEDFLERTVRENGNTS